MTEIPMTLAVEDALSEAVLRTILQQSNQAFIVSTCLRKNGYGYLKKILPGLNYAAQGMPYLVLTDLDNAECPLALISNWLNQPKHHNLMIRVAVREVEAWLLAHREAFSEFLGISIDLIPKNVDEIADPKQFLINLVRRSRKKLLKESIVPALNSTAHIGKDYNAPLIEFVSQKWQAESAKDYSPSLARTIKTIKNFEPMYFTRE